MNLENLTKKNQEFIHIATHQLMTDGKSDEEIKTILEEALPSILDNQKKGIPARTFLGAPTVWAGQFTKKINASSDTSQTPKNTNPWLMWLDTSLVFLGIIALLNGVMSLFGSNSSTITGFTTVVIMSFTGGAAIYAMYHFIYRHLAKPKDQRPRLWVNYILVAITIMVWISLVSLAAYLPNSINPQLPDFALIIIGGGALLGKFYLQKKYNILSALSPQRPVA